MRIFCNQKDGPSSGSLNGMTASWLKKTLTLANIRGSGRSNKKADITYATSQGVSIRTIIEAGDWNHTSTMCGHYMTCLPREVLVRILEQTSASIQGVHITKIAADNPLGL